MKLLCIIPSISDSNVFRVNIDIDGDTMVADLKTKIKQEKPGALSGVDADSLTLYKIHIDLSDPKEYKKIMHDVFQPHYVFKPKDELLPISYLSGEFEEGKEKVIQILVEPPPSKSIGP